MQLTVRDVSKFLQVSESTVTRWIKQRGLPSHHVGGQYHFNRVELLEWATANRLKVCVEAFDRLAAEDEPSPSLVEAIETGGIFHHIKDSTRSVRLRALVEVLPLPETVDRELLLRLFLAREASASTAIGDGIALPHVRNPIVLHVDAPDGHRVLSGPSRRLRCARRQGRAHALLAHLPHGAKPFADSVAAVLRIARCEVQGGRAAPGPTRRDPAGGAREWRQRLAAPAHRGLRANQSMDVKDERDRSANSGTKRGSHGVLATVCGAGGVVVACLLALIPTLQVLVGGTPLSVQLGLGRPPRDFLHRPGRA